MFSAEKFQDAALPRFQRFNQRPQRQNWVLPRKKHAAIHERRLAFALMRGQIGRQRHWNRLNKLVAQIAASEHEPREKIIALLFARASEKIGFVQGADFIAAQPFKRGIRLKLGF